MCIICNTTTETVVTNDANDFLYKYGRSRKAMEEATDAMLVVSRLDIAPEHKHRYDRAHKQMKRISRDWNMIEHTREQDAPTP